MNQDSFRRLLEVPRPSAISSALGAGSTSRSRLVVQTKQGRAAEVVSKPAFKPRNIRKSAAKDCDSKIPQDDRTNADNNINVEHSPSKGLDFALLEQERAKVGLLSTNDVDELEQAFAESSAVQDSEPVAPIRRTREDLIRELKQRRSGDAGKPSALIQADLQLEEAKQKGKFKPIGLTSTSKRKKVGANADGKKKKRKVDSENDKKHSDSQVKPLTASGDIPPKTTSEQPKQNADEEYDDNFDIFAGAGDYSGVEIDDHGGADIATSQPTEVSPSLPRRWIAMDEPEHLQARPQLSSQLSLPIPESAKVEADQEVEGPPIRLAPLESSAVPSIKELLNIHDASDKYEKKLKRKEKKQRKRGGNGKGSEDDE